MTKKRLIIASVFIILVCAGLIWLGRRPAHPTQPRTREEIIRACDVRMRKAVNAMAAACGRRVLGVSKCVDSRKAGAATYAAKYMAFYDRAVVAKANPQEVQKQAVLMFYQNVISPYLLGTATACAIEDSIKDVEVIEDGVIVELRQEMLGRPLARGEKPQAIAAFRQTIHAIVEQSKADPETELTGITRSEAIRHVVYQCMFRLNPDIDAADATNALRTCVLGCSEMLKTIAETNFQRIGGNPGQLERDTVAALTRMASKSDGMPDYLKKQLERHIDDRRDLWMRAVRKTLP